MTNLELKDITNESVCYLGSIVINDKLANIFFDDYGQCYVIQYYDTKTQQLKDISCGTYCDWKTEILDYFNDSEDKKMIKKEDLNVIVAEKIKCGST